MKKLTDKELKDFIRQYGDVLPDPVIYPRITQYYYNLYVLNREKNKN